ncbi:hypothetical protein Cocul_00083 [Corynebacterium oculi]|uniref:Uncharacterized protein n=1 Tax=Corynebacterium oculi TaxID=1544416 RepID=A0A0Q0YEW8_9CORY|nr:hypothetical protein Cocul_00083 [Corynebacterium oculi]
MPKTVHTLSGHTVELDDEPVNGTMTLSGDVVEED